MPIGRSPAGSTGRQPLVQPPIGSMLSALAARTYGSSTGGGFGMSQAQGAPPFRRKREIVFGEGEGQADQPRGMHIALGATRGYSYPRDTASPYEGLENPALRDPESRMRWLYRGKGGSDMTGEKLLALGQAGVRWKGTMGSLRQRVGGTGAGFFSGMPDDFRKLVLARMSGGEV